MPKFDFSKVIPWLKTFVNDEVKGFAILDGENAIMHRSNNVKFVKNYFDDCKTMNLKPIIVAKVSDVKRLKKRIPDVEIPDDIIFFFLHGNNKNCPDDAFIIELYNHLKTNSIDSKIFTIDKFSNRKSWDQKVHNTMISYNLFPTRPRSHLDPSTIVYKPDIDLVLDTEITDKISLRV